MRHRGGSTSNKLRDVFNKHQCDKGSKHCYDTAYEKEFAHLVNKPINILEIGVLRGESVASWLEYFPSASVYAIDTFDRIPPEDIPILHNSRVTWAVGDSTCISINDKVRAFGVTFDIIIDDGLHTPKANMLTFLNLVQFLKDRGTYYVEDFFPMHKMTSNELNQKHLQKNKGTWNINAVTEFLTVIAPYNVASIDNRMLTGHSDSYIYKITKVQRRTH
jgi:hypothetical protein